MKKRNIQPHQTTPFTIGFAAGIILPRAKKLTARAQFFGKGVLFLLLLVAGLLQAQAQVWQSGDQIVPQLYRDDISSYASQFGMSVVGIHYITEQSFKNERSK